LRGVRLRRTNRNDYENPEMVEDIDARKKAEEELRKSKEELEKRVKELEEFYNMAVGRELRMIELKKEIESLKADLSKYKKDELV
jgi:hypothetical protein